MSVKTRTIARKKQIYTNDPININGQIVTYRLTPDELAEVHRKYGPPGTVKYPERMTNAKGYRWVAEQQKEGRS
ncbi:MULTISPECIES: hypothetical protein [unclassified Sporolactobacillus]|uniref:hypothetical protein n=1 Tax=unclassified Sporolactobacillus TaxID=2628533 RepID=UPI002368BA6E|nr:hypothetical protein [Sporolactobacillus sp. CQH2019]MDD9150420.1 hypothetical protein [Sporolactobacillus sp. CQH2019]